MGVWEITSQVRGRKVFLHLCWAPKVSMAVPHPLKLGRLWQKTPWAMQGPTQSQALGDEETACAGLPVADYHL